jgi:AcrR family transcriptional regulator
VSELADRVGVTVPSIHHYRRLGLLPHPAALSPNRFLYDQRHVDALVMIRLLRERRNLPLATIRDVLPELLAAGQEEAFRTEMWDEVLGAHQDTAGPSAAPERLLAVAREAFARRGYAGVNVGDICEAAGIAKGSFYRYFESKDEIFVAAARSIADAVAKSLAGSQAPMTEQLATAKLQEVLEPLLPLLLEVAVRARHGDPRLSEVASGMTTRLATVVGNQLKGHNGSGARAGRRVADTALTALLRQAFGFDSPDS